MRRLLLFGLVALPWPLSAGAEEAEAGWFRAEYRGEVREEVTLTSRRATALDPDNALEIASAANRLYFDFGLRLGLGERLGVVVKDRAIHLLEERQTGDLTNAVEDCYLSLRLPAGARVEAGKKNVREGVGYAFNPVDYLATATRLSGANPDPAAQKENRRGNYLLRAEAPAGPVTLSATYVPRLAAPARSGINVAEQWLLKGRLFAGGHELSLYGYRAGSWRGGLAWDTVLGRALELHFEGSLQRGSGARVPTPEGPLVRLQPRAGEALVARLVAGGHYTFRNGWNLIGEYYYNGAGYTGSEFGLYFAMLEAPRPAVDVSRLDALRNLGSLQGRNLVFTRLSGVRLASLEVTGFCVLHPRDGSRLITLDAGRTVGRLRLGAAVDSFQGRARSQFGILPVGHDVRAHASFFY
jgi:hypothetical protein